MYASHDDNGSTACLPSPAQPSYWATSLEMVYEMATSRPISI